MYQPSAFTAMSTLVNSLYASANTPAIIIPSKSREQTVTYGALTELVSDFQYKLAQLGIGPSNAVSIALPNGLEFAIAFLAASWQRAIAAPLNPAYKQEEFEFYISDLSSTLAIVPRDAVKQDAPIVRAARKHGAAVAECWYDAQRQDVVLELKVKGKLEGVAPRGTTRPNPDDVALVLHTSGTTGRPKAVPLTHHNLTTTMKNVQKTYLLTPDDRTMLVMPLFHVHGLLAGLLAPLLSGGSVIIPPRFSAREFWQDFTRYKANWYTAVPTIHQILLRSPIPKPMPRIRFIRSCSSPLSPAVFAQLEETFKAPVLEAYAMTEAAHQMTSNPLPPAKRKPGSVGIGQGVEVRILSPSGVASPQGSEGEICVKGVNVTKGYINNEQANKDSFTEDGFFRTGDQGKLDEDNYVIITGRIKELINKGGEKISPVELDNVLAQHPAVAEAVSFAIDDETYGQDIGVAIVLKDGQSVSADELREWISEKVAKFKVPKEVRRGTARGRCRWRPMLTLPVHRFSSQTQCPRPQQAKCSGAWSPLPWPSKPRPSSPASSRGGKPK